MAGCSVGGVMIGVAAVMAGGCGPGRPTRVPAPSLDPATVATAVMAAADGDSSGTISGAELAKVPALVDAIGVLDSDGDKALSREELVAWLQVVKDSRVAITSFNATVTHKGKPLVDATVRLVPESFMGGETKAAEGRTDQDGVAMVTIPDSKYPGVNCGLYRVEITGTDGKPLPASFNTSTKLGVAVGGFLPENGMATFVLE